MINIAVFVSGGGTNLQALIDAQDRGEIKNGKSPLFLHPTKTLTPWKEQKKPESPQPLSAVRPMTVRRLTTRQF